MHHLLGDHALATKLVEHPALGVEQLAPQALVGDRALLDRAVVRRRRNERRSGCGGSCRGRACARRCRPAPSPRSRAPPAGPAPPRPPGCAPSPPPSPRSGPSRGRADGSRAASSGPGRRASRGRRTSSGTGSGRAAGTALPASVVSGSASAAANETAPRMPAHADQGGIRPLRVRVALPDPPAEQAREVRRREDPDDAARGSRSPTTIAPYPISVDADSPESLSRIDRQLQADQHEEQRVQEEDDDLPDGVALDARLRRRELRRVRAHVDADGDGGEHGRRIQQLGRQVREVPARGARS